MRCAARWRATTADDSIASVEIELKYRARDDAVLARLAAAPALGPAVLDPPRTVDELDRYLDTADGRLAEARWACRLRTRDGRTVLSLKGPPDTELVTDPAALHRRPEVEGPATPLMVCSSSRDTHGTTAP